MTEHKPQVDSKFNSTVTSLQDYRKRKLDHLIDVKEGRPFTAIDRELGEAFLKGLIPYAKFKILFAILHHSANFQIKRRYLEGVVHSSSLQRYLDELESEGYIVREEWPREDGGFEIIYHTQRVAAWEIPKGKKPRKKERKRQVADQTKTCDSKTGESETVDHNESNLNQTKETKPMGGRNSEQVECQAPETKSLPPSDEGDEVLSDSKFCAKQFQKLYPHGRGYLPSKQFDLFNKKVYREVQARGLEEMTELMVFHGRWMLSNRYKDLTVNEFLYAVLRWDQSEEKILWARTGKEVA